jgi:phosphocarrier protein
MLTETATRTMHVRNRYGLHLRVCSAIVTAVGRYQADVRIQKDSQSADAASIFDLMLLAASQGTRLVLSATGDEAEEALEAVAGLLGGELASTTSLGRKP